MEIFEKGKSLRVRVTPGLAIRKKYFWIDRYPRTFLLKSVKFATERYLAGWMDVDFQESTSWMKIFTKGKSLRSEVTWGLALPQKIFYPRRYQR